MNVFPSKYVLDIKSSGLNARLVTLGLLQMHGMDYMETYTSAVNIITVRMIFAQIVILGLELDQMDVITEFLYGNLDEVIYMKVPEGLRNPKRPDLVSKLLKSLYGLRQAPRHRYAKIHLFLVDIWFKNSPNYPFCILCIHLLSSLSLSCMSMIF